MSVLFISFAHGGVIALMVLAFGHISGAHINPAVTIPMIITRKIGVKDGIAYIGSQLAGAVVASTTLAIILPELGKKVNFGVHMGPQDIINNSVASGFLVEALLTFFLVLVIFMAAVHRKAAPGMGALAIGGTVFLTIWGMPNTTWNSQLVQFGQLQLSGSNEYEQGLFSIC